MGLITKVAALGAVAAAGVLAANRDKVAKAVRGALAPGAKAPAKAKTAARSAGTKSAGAKPAGAKVKKEPHVKAPRAARRKARRAHRAHPAAGPT